MLFNYTPLCSHPTEEVRQCIIFDSDRPGARLIGIEYILSERLFRSLPEEEKQYWHSHDYEVSSGILIAPRVPDMAEKRDMQKLANTYGKTWHTWQVDRGDELPIGPPQLMGALTADGQVDPALLAARDARYGVSREEKKAGRKNLEYPEIVDPAANSWLSGETWQVEMKKVPVKLRQGSGEERKKTVSETDGGATSRQQGKADFSFNELI